LYISRSRIIKRIRRITKIMAVTWNTGNSIESKPKKTRQGKGQHSIYSATSRNKARKKYRGQGK